MAVYVDDMLAEYRAFPGARVMLMSHLYADTTEELLEMVDKIGVKRKWIQHAGTYREHFDIAKGKRDRAIKAGAIPTTWRHYGQFIPARKPLRAQEGLPRPDDAGVHGVRDDGR